MMRPKVKPEHSGYRAQDGTVRLGSVVYGIGVEIADPSGWVWSLVEAMDGTRTVTELADVVSAAHPQVSASDVARAVADLYEAGHLEDADAPAPALTPQQVDRYSRGVPLLRWLDRTPRRSAWEMQEALDRSRVLLVGLGGTGGYAAQALVASGVGHLHCVDPDVVGLSNLNRQPLYRERDIGRFKAEVAAQDLGALNSDVEVTCERRLVEGPQDVADLLGGGAGPYDLLLMCADQPPQIRRWANQACLASGTAWVDGGYRGPLATAGVHVPGVGGCWECVRDGEIRRRDLGVAPGEDPAAASPRMPWNPTTAITAGLSGLLVAHAAISLLTGAPPLEPGFLFGVNLAALEDPVLLRSARLPDCPACGDRANAAIDRAGAGERPISGAPE
ncbi:HesA/MoeB/ThiF family protein [Kitasatospora aureofaciens]|uniref:HesA/MoeB/ThiF family protein n=1 Tax=Kitasatospora aureofaciens TaxID=1894 RepID=UPI00052784D5|nr:ThiF family adenylyltransferase [Kitasatospora aureofaciens]